MGAEATAYPLLKNIAGRFGPPMGPGGRWETGWCWFVPGKHLTEKKSRLREPSADGAAVLIAPSPRLRTWRRVARGAPRREPTVPGSGRPEGRDPVCRARQTAPPRDTSGLRAANGFNRSFGGRERARPTLGSPTWLRP